VYFICFLVRIALLLMLKEFLEYEETFWMFQVIKLESYHHLKTQLQLKHFFAIVIRIFKYFNE